MAKITKPIVKPATPFNAQTRFSKKQAADTVVRHIEVNVAKKIMLGSARFKKELLDLFKNETELLAFCRLYPGNRDIIKSYKELRRGDIEQSEVDRVMEAVEKIDG